MLKKTITYTDFDGNERTEDFYFNFTKAELMEMELSEYGGFTNLINKIVQENDVARIAEIFKDIVLKAYGEKSLDGKRFVKNQELRDAFAQTEAYSQLYMSLVFDADEATKFVRGIMPSDVQAEALKLDRVQMTEAEMTEAEE